MIEVGGLCIVGTERHESRRIDNQLRGRAGRQGDPGFSKFYLSLEDDLMRLFGGERMDRMFSTLGVDETVEISHPLLAKSIEAAQRRVEGMNFAIRKNVLEYDNVMNLQRQIIYKQRREVLEGHDLHAYFQRIVEERMRSILADFMSRSSDPADWDREVLRSRVEDEFGPLPALTALLHSRESEDGEEWLNVSRKMRLLNLNRVPLKLDRMICSVRWSASSFCRQSIDTGWITST